MRYNFISRVLPRMQYHVQFSSLVLFPGHKPSLTLKEKWLKKRINIFRSSFESIMIMQILHTHTLFKEVRNM